MGKKIVLNFALSDFVWFGWDFYLVLGLESILRKYYHP